MLFLKVVELCLETLQVERVNSINQVIATLQWLLMTRRRRIS